MRVAAAICVDAVAFVVWDLTARSPLRLARDVAAATRHPRAFLTGILAFAVGALLLAGSAALVIPLATSGGDFVVLETIALVAALAVDQLIGPELRRRRARDD